MLAEYNKSVFSFFLMILVCITWKCTKIIHHENAIFLALTETHLHKDHLDAEINMENYTAIRADRHIRSHEGVANYIRNDMATNMETLDSFSNGTTELLGVHLKNLNLLVITIYRPPNTTLGNFNQAISRLTEILKNPQTNPLKLWSQGISIFLT